MKEYDKLTPEQRKEIDSISIAFRQRLSEVFKEDKAEFLVFVLLGQPMFQRSLDSLLQLVHEDRLPELLRAYADCSQLLSDMRRRHGKIKE